MRRRNAGEQTDTELDEPLGMRWVWKEGESMTDRTTNPGHCAGREDRDE